MKFWIAEKGIIYNPSKYMDGKKRYFTSKEKAEEWLGYVGRKVNKEHSWMSSVNTLDEVDIEGAG